MNARTQHWTDDDLLGRVYGLDPAPGLALEHFDDCAECAERWQRLAGARAGVVASASSAACSDERLRAQRAEIWRRVERPVGRRILRAVPAAATCCVLLLAVALNRPAPQPLNHEVASAVSDEQLFAEIASVVNTDSPRAVEPIRGLFNEANSLEAQ